MHLEEQLPLFAAPGRRDREDEPDTNQPNPSEDDSPEEDDPEGDTETEGEEPSPSKESEPSGKEF
jgi:hypothetical protein